VWQDDDENNPIQQCLSYSTAPQTTDFSAGLMILVSTSEDMSNLQLLGLRASDGTMYDASNGLSVVAETVSPDQYFFTISLDPEVYINEDDYRLVFAGEDLAGNLLEERQIYPSYSADCIDIGDIPQRASDGEWQPPAMGGNDEVHTIHIDLCLNALVAATDRTSNFCFSAAADIDPLCGTTICTNTAVLLTNQSYYLEGEFQYHWNFGDDASPAFIDENTFESHEVSWASPGTKTVELLATYLTNNVTQTFTMEIEVVDDPFCSVDLATALSQTITAPSPGETDGAIHLILPDNYPTEQLTDIVWYPLDENGNTMTDNQGNIITIADNNNTPTDLVDIAAGKYRFSATVAMRCEHIEKDIELLDNCFEVSITPVCNGDGTIQLTVDILGGQSPYSYLMNGGMSASQSNNTLAWATLNSFMEETNLPAHFMTTIFMPNFFTVTITDANNCQSVRTGSATCTPCTTDLVVTQVICPNPLSNEIIVVFNKIVTDISAGIPSGFSGPDISLSLSNNQQFALFSVLDATTGCTLTGIASCTNGVFTETGTIVGIDNCAGYPSFNDPPLFTQIYIPQSVCAEQQICVPYSVIDVDGLGTLMPNKPNTTLYPDVEESTVRTGTLCWTPTSADIGTQHLRLYVMDLHCNSLITTLLSSNLGITFLEKR
ncbi:MAG TPA: hypothetical protein PKH93_06865, partial [Chitinophagales bacterium]|nr:hypothetical protein [Chitinophagales bacterium]